MTVTFREERTGLRSARNELGIRTYTRVFLLESDDKNDGPYTVGSNASLPKIGSVHPEDISAWCRSLDVEVHADWKAWHVTANYSTEFEMAENPLLEPARIRLVSEAYREVVWKTRTGTAILNSAGDFFSDPAPEKERHRKIFMVSKNVSSVPTWLIDTEEDPVNDSAFVIKGLAVAAGKAKLGRVEIGELERRNGVEFYPLSFEIAISARGWDLQPLDAGFRKRNGSGDLVRITTYGDGTDVTTPVPLDGSGDVLDDPTPATAVFGSYDIYPTLNFNLLPLT